MDLFKDIQWGNVFTVITLLTTLFIAIRDYTRVRAENEAKHAEANKTETDAAGLITESALKLLSPKDKQIEQQDLQITRLLVENQQLSSKYNELHSSHTVLSSKYEEVLKRLEKCEQCLKSLGGDCIND